MGWSSILLKCLFVRFKVLLSFSKHWHPNTGQITLVINFCTFRNKEKQIRVVAKHISHPVEYQLKGVFVKFNLKKLILNQWFSTGGEFPTRGEFCIFQGGNYQWFPTGGPQSDFWGSMSLFMEKMKEYVIVKAVVDIRGGELGSCLGK